MATLVKPHLWNLLELWVRAGKNHEGLNLSIRDKNTPRLLNIHFSHLESSRVAGWLTGRYLPGIFGM